MSSPRSSVSAPNAPAAIGPYAQAIRVRAGELLFASGQIAIDPTTGRMVEGDAAAQTRQVMRNLEAVLAAAGATLADAVRATIYLVDMDDFGAVNEAYGSFFDGLEPPARATVEVSRLPKGARVEIDLIAAVPKVGA